MIRALIAALAVSSALALAACGEKSEPDLATLGPPPEPVFEITGEWRGELRQKGVRPFPIASTIASLEGAKGNTVRYGGAISCVGTWRFLDHRVRTYRFREIITRGRGGKCKGEGIVKLTERGSDQLSYEFRGGGVVSTGVLTRRDSSAG